MSNLSGNLSGKSAIVTGASSGMGRATALTLAAAGAKVLGVARREAELKSLQEEAAAAGHEISILVGDVSKREDDEAMVKACLEQFGKVDIAVNAAGINLPDRLLEVLTDENWHNLLNINLTGAYYLTRALLEPMEAQGGGLIVHVGSVSGRWGDFSGVAYQASKHGLMGLSYGTMMERREKGIRVSVIMPGLCETPLLQKRPVPPSQEKLDKAMKPQDIADAALFLACLPARTYVPELILMPGMLQCVGNNVA